MHYSRGKIIAKLVYGFDQLPCQNLIGDILVTAVHDDAYTGKGFASKLRELHKHVLRKLFKKGLSIVTRSDKGRLHCHLGVEMPSQCTEFDWVSFEQSEKYYELYKKYHSIADLRFYRYFTAKYRRSLPLDWQLINRKLMQAGKRFGLGRVFLTPIRKNKEAYKWYLVSNVPRRRDPRDKQVHFFLSWGLKIATTFQLNNKFTGAYRTRLKKFGLGLQLTSDNYKISLRSVLGSNWYFKIKDLVRNIDTLTEEQQLRYDNLQRTMRLHLMRSS